MKFNVLDLDPKSIAKIFQTVDAFTDLNISNLKSKDELKVIFEKYNPAEKYFCIYYILKQLSTKNKQSRFYQTTKEFEDLRDLGDFEDSYDAYEIISSYAFEISKYCSSQIDSFKKNLEYFLNARTITDESEDEAFKLASEWKYLPLAKGEIKSFKKSVHAIFKKILNPTDIDKIINNSFQVMPIPDAFKLLNINFDVKKDIEDAFYRLYILYGSQEEELKNISDREETRKAKYKNKKIGNTNFSRADYISNDPLLNKNATEKVNIAKIMFISFPYIRSNYNKYRNNHIDTSIDKYLKAICKNIRPKA